MKNLKQLERLRKIHRMIKLENTGTPSELAEKLHISTRLTYLLLEQLREFDAPLYFNRRTKTYYYKNDFELTINISVQVITHEKLVNIYAGGKFADYVISLQGGCSKQNYLCYLKKKLDVAG
ncbi:DNA-binding protein [Lutimonas vermicola]|uniref:DNA-binding protein n=1 Tax=Lutimonas vermicola TaxID=414288 RepID=A0ABU9L2Y4_9FLAO